MEVLGSFYQRKIRRKHRKVDLSKGTLCKAPSESSVNSLASGLLSRVLHFTTRRRDPPPSRPNSCHFTKLAGEIQHNPCAGPASPGGMGAPWPPAYHSRSTTDILGHDPGVLRKGLDQYSSHGSMESVEHGPLAYSSCQHLHGNRDSAYSSVSAGSSIPEGSVAGASLGKERSRSMDSMLVSRGPDGATQADSRSAYNRQKGETRASSAVAQSGDEGSGRGTGSASRRHAVCNCGGSLSGVYRKRLVWNQAHDSGSCEDMQVVPGPPTESDSHAATRHDKRPNSWSSLEQARSLRALKRGSWHHSSGSVASGKSLLTTDGQLHTLLEKSPECSPTTRPKQNPSPVSKISQHGLLQGSCPMPKPKPKPRPKSHCARTTPSCLRSTSMNPVIVKEDGCFVHGHQEHIGDKKTMKAGYQDVPLSTATEPPNLSQATPSLQVSVMMQKPAEEQISLQSTKDDKDPESLWCSQSTENPERKIASEEISFTSGVSSEDQLGSGQIRQSKEGGGFQSLHASKNDVPEVDLASQVSPRSCSDLCQLSQQQQQQQNMCPSAELDTTTEGAQGPESLEVPLSVLEKVNQFEQRSLSDSPASSRSSSLIRASSTKGSSAAIQEIRSRLKMNAGSSTRLMQTTEERGNRPHPDTGNLQRHRGLEQPLSRSPQSKLKALQRSKSTLQLSEDHGKEFDWKEELQGILGSFQDTSFNRAYRDRIRHAQSEVLRSTSFRRRDLSVNPIFPSMHLSLERKARETSPEPVSPHGLKERDINASQTVRKNSIPKAPEFQSVGPSITRIGGRKRLSLEQKKLSYSEPEKINQVGQLAEENFPSLQRKTSQPFLFPETSVADKCRLFELAAKANTGPSLVCSRPQLKQLQQQDCLVENKGRGPCQRRTQSTRPSVNSSDSQSLSSLSTSDSSSLPGGAGFFTPTPTGRHNLLRLPVHRPRETPLGDSSSERELSKTTVASLEPLQQRGALKPTGPSHQLDDSKERPALHIHPRSSPRPSCADQMAGDNWVSGTASRGPRPALTTETRLLDDVIQERLEEPSQGLSQCEPPERQRNLAASYSWLCPSDSVTQGCRPDSVTQEEPHGVVTQGCRPESVTQEEPHGVVTQGCRPESVTQEEPHGVVTQGCRPESVTQEEPHGVVTQGCRPDSVTQGCRPDSVTQEEPHGVGKVEEVVGSLETSHGLSTPAQPLLPLHASVPSAGHEKRKEIRLRDSASMDANPCDKEPRFPAGSTEENVEPEYLVWPRRAPTVQEVRAEVLARELMSRDKSLKALLYSWPGNSTMDLMERVFPTAFLLPQQQGRSNHMEERWQNKGSLTGDLEAQGPAKKVETDLDEEEVDLHQKKVELAAALRLSLGALRQEKEGLAEGMRRNEVLGLRMEALVRERCRPNEVEKYRMFVGDLGRMVQLLLSLCWRLARVESSLATEDCAEERKALERRHAQLCSQHQDARELKENLDRREQAVLDILSGYLSGTQLRDFQRFVWAGPVLLIRQRLLDELIRQGEEQLRCLEENLLYTGHPTDSSDPKPDSSPSIRSVLVTSL